MIQKRKACYVESQIYIYNSYIWIIIYNKHFYVKIFYISNKRSLPKYYEKQNVLLLIYIIIHVIHIIYLIILHVALNVHYALYL